MNTEKTQEGIDYSPFLIGLTFVFAPVIYFALKAFGLAE